MRLIKLFVFAVALSITNSVFAQSRVYPFTFSKGEVSYNCDMDDDIPLGGVCRMRFDTWKTTGKSYQLTLSIFGFDKTIAKWANSVKGKEDINDKMTIVLSNGKNLKTLLIRLIDNRRENLKGSDEIGSIFIVASSKPEDFEQLTIYDIESVKYMGLTFDIKAKKVKTSPTIAAMLETLKKQ